MIQIDNFQVYNLANAVYSARNPLNSWARFDSDKETNVLGENDMALAKRLINAGSDHRKFLREIFVTMDITAPQYWVAELDTYKVSTVRNSCSLQHKGASRDFVINDFTIDDMDDESKVAWENLLAEINRLRQKFVETNDYAYFRRMRQLLPMGYNYKFTWTANYEVLYNIYKSRKSHKLVEWHQFCDYIVENAPYFKEFFVEA